MRILFTALDDRNRELYYCVPLTSLKAVRDGSILQLCRSSSRDGSFWLWARLKFVHYERLVLFYSTFVALKRQDNQETHPQLLEEPRDMDDEEHFGGVIRAGQGMLHALRLFECRGSKAVRLEVRPYRSSREEVPIWTAFLTKYVIQRDQYFFDLESDRRVIMTRPRPEPFLFLSGYALPQARNGSDFLLTFDTKDGECLLEAVAIHKLASFD